MTYFGGFNLSVQSNCIDHSHTKLRFSEIILYIVSCGHCFVSNFLIWSHDSQVLQWIAAMKEVTMIEPNLVGNPTVGCMYVCTTL